MTVQDHVELVAVAFGVRHGRERAEALLDALDVHDRRRSSAVAGDEGLIELRRGRGATVRASGADRPRLHHLADRLLAEAARLGFGVDDVTRLLKERS